MPPPQSRKNGNKQLSLRSNKKKKVPSSTISNNIDDTKTIQQFSFSQHVSWMVVLSAAFLALALFWDSLPVAFTWFHDDYTNDDKYSRLTKSFPMGNKIAALNSTEMGGAGTFAKKRIRKGEVILKSDASDVLPNEQTRQQPWYPKLVTMMEAALSQFRQDEAPTLKEMVLVVILLMELHKGADSRWHAYIEALPTNVSQVSWYWTKDEVECVVPRLNGRKQPEILQLKLANFHAIFDSVWNDFCPLVKVPLELGHEAEWAFLMISTRSFEYNLIPLFDMTNHDPTKSQVMFRLADGSAHLVATRDYQAGEQVFNNYNKLTPSTMAEFYAFLDPNAAYVNVPSISKDLQESPATRDIDPCTNEDMVFFGDVPEGRVEARFRHLHQTTYYKPFHPGQLVYQCVRVMLQSENGPTIARYMAEKIEQDLKVYEDMANAEHCQNPNGNFPMIQQVNEVTARLLRGALSVAKRAARGEIDYPAISYP